MTREEAIKFLNEQKEFLLKGCFWEETRMNINEAFDMAIEALEADVPDINVGDMISRQDAIDAPEKLIKDCNPDHFVGHQKFIEFMDDAEIGSFGNWQFANGFNLGLTAAEVEIKNLPSAQPDLEEDEDIPMEYFENGGI